MNMLTLTTLKATADMAAIRSATYNGTSYLVVPVVAIVEGVLQGMNAEEPELATAAEFGKYPEGWNGRPVVMDHPVDTSGNPISANAAPVLEAYSFGHIFNSRVEDSKLKVEAWIDTTKADAMGGNFAETVQRINSGQIVEVSVGAYITPVAANGTYKGKKYSAVWSNVVPDHLALLSNGTKGACSVEDGCGTPRTNKETDVADDSKTPTLKTSGKNPEVVTECTGDGACSCGCEKVTPESLHANAIVHLSERLADNKLPKKMLSPDISRMLKKAIRIKFGGDTYCVGYNSQVALFEQYVDGVGYIFMQVPFDMSEKGGVSFTGDPEEVNITMSISKPEKGNDDMSTNADSSAATTAEQDAAKVKANAEAAEQAKLEAAAQAEQAKKDEEARLAAEEAAKPKTVSAFIETAPPEMQEVLNESVRLHTAKKAALVAGLVANEACDFPEADLKAMSVETLERINKMTVKPSDFSGQGAPNVQDPAKPNGEVVNFAAPPKPFWEKDTEAKAS